MADEAKSDATQNTDSAGQAAVKATSDATQNTDESGEKVAFTPAQQSKLDELINAAYAKGVSKKDREIAQLREQLEGLSKKPEDGERKQKKMYSADEVQDMLADFEKKKSEEVAKYRTDKVASQRQVLEKELFMAAVQAGAGKFSQDFVDLVMLRGFVKINDEGEREYSPPKGVHRIGDDGQEVDLVGFLGRILETMPHMKEPVAQTRGTGSSGGGGTGRRGVGLSGLKPQEIRDMPEEEFTQRVKEQDHAQGRPVNRWL